MRPKFVFILVLLALLVLGAALLLKQPSGNVATPPVNPATTAETGSNAVTGPASPPAPAATPVTMTPADALTAEQRQAAIDAETERLQEWSMNDDPASL